MTRHPRRRGAAASTAALPTIATALTIPNTAINPAASQHCAWVRRRWPTHGPLMAKAGRGSYATYVLHPVTPAFRVMPLGPELKFLVVAVVAVPVCFVVGYAVTRLPGVGRVI